MQRFLPLLLVLFASPLCAQSIIWLSECTDRTFCLNPGSCTEGTAYAYEKAGTTCNISSKLDYSYKIDLGNNGSIDIQSFEDTLNIPLPVGTHRITWRADDNCGNVSTGCSYLVTVKDCNWPNLLCRNGLTQNLELPDCSAAFNAADFIISVTDNCTPANLIQKGIREAGSGTGFPSETDINFGICDQGLHILEIWVKDQNNLTNQCNSYVLVQNNSGVCECNIDANIHLAGCARSADSLKLDNYIVRAELQGMPLQGQPISKALQKNSTDSCYSLSFETLPLNGQYSGSVRAQRGGDPLAGVSTFDLVLINKHILGQQLLKNFYQVLAADVNQSHTITTFDIIEIRKLILGVYDTFPATPPWRFIRPIANPLNLLGYDAVRDTYPFSIPNLQDDTTFQHFDFVGIKMGDANSNATLNGPAEDRDGAMPLLLLTGDQYLQAGEEYWVPLQPAENIRLEGWQLEIQFDPGALEVKDLRGIPPEFASINPDGMVRISRIFDETETFGPQVPLGYLLVRARKPIQLSKVITNSTFRLSPQVYPAEGPAIRPLVFRVGEQAPGALFFPPQPNPFAGETTFSLLLDRESPIELEVFDLAGRRVYQTATLRDAGYQALTIPAGALSPGVWAYRLRAGEAVASGRLVAVER